MCRVEFLYLPGADVYKRQDESGLYESTFAEFAEDFINQLTLAHGVVNLHIQFLAHLADLDVYKRQCLS